MHWAKSNPANIPIGITAPMVQNDKCRIKKGGEKRPEKDSAKAENCDVTKIADIDPAFDEVADRAGSDESFNTVANEPAQDHCRGNIAFQFHEAVGRKRSQKHEPPPAPWGQEKNGQQDGIGRPKNRNRMGL